MTRIQFESVQLPNADSYPNDVYEVAFIKAVPLMAVAMNPFCGSNIATVIYRKQTILTPTGKRLAWYPYSINF